MAAKPSVLKRQRERKRAEKAEQKREERARRAANRTEGGGGTVASREDLAGYGIEPEPEPGDPPRRRTR
jgi:hypothetical protein